MKETDGVRWKWKFIKSDLYKGISAGSNRYIFKDGPKEESMGGKYERSGSSKPYRADPVCMRATFKPLHFKYPIYFHWSATDRERLKIVTERY